MKQLFLVFSFAALIGKTSFACPILEGSFLCKQNSYHKDTVYSFTQEKVKANWLYTMTASTLENKEISSFSFLTDNQEREVIDAITGQKLLATAVCFGDKLRVFGTTKVGEISIKFSELLSLSQAGDLINISLDIHGNTIKELCERIK